MKQRSLSDPARAQATRRGRRFTRPEGQAPRRAPPVRARHERADARSDLDIPLRGTRRLSADGRARGARRAQEGTVGSVPQRAPGKPLPRRDDPRRDQGADRRRAAAAERLLRQSRQEALHRPAVLPDPPARRARCRTACPARAPTTSFWRRRSRCRTSSPDARVILVSKDINLRIKAAVLGVHAEDYYSDKTLEDADVLYTGMTALPADFWEQHGKDMRSWKEGDRTFYELTGPAVERLAAEPGRLRGQPAGHRGHRPQASTANGHASSCCATTAASATTSGASPRATASRISRSICSWIRRSTS